MELKPALSYIQQINRLSEFHKLTITNTDKAINILKTVNYYRLSGYGIGLKKQNIIEQFIEGISIKHLFKLYCFDSQFKNNLIRTIKQIEITLRTQIAYHIAMKYGADALMNGYNFIEKINKNNESIYLTLIKKLNEEIKRQKNSPFVKHHIEEYNGKFPIWVSVELMSFGNLSTLFSILQY